MAYQVRLLEWFFGRVGGDDVAGISTKLCEVCVT